MRWDAIIVGAGPAGATLAILLARSGWQTLLIDSGRFPRDKVCGECLSTAALPVLREIGLEQQVRDAAVRQQRLRITVPNRASLDFPLRNDGVEGVLGISRRFLDALLVQEASRSGVHVLEEHRLRRVMVDAGQACGVMLQSVREPRNRPIALHGSTIIAADGRASAVVRQTGRTVLSGPRLVGIKCHRGALTHEAGTIEMISLPGGYLGRCTVDGAEENTCGLLPRATLRRVRGSIHRLMTDWLPTVEFAGERWLSMPDVRQQRSIPRCEGVLYVGDALATIEPLSGQGMAMALRSAQLAAELLTASESKRAGFELQHRYARAWDAGFESTVRWAATLGWLLRHPRMLAALAAAAPLSCSLEEMVLRACYRGTRITPWSVRKHRLSVGANSAASGGANTCER